MWALKSNLSQCDFYSSFHSVSSQGQVHTQERVEVVTTFKEIMTASGKKGEGNLFQRAPG